MKRHTQDGACTRKTQLPQINHLLASKAHTYVHFYVLLFEKTNGSRGAVLGNEGLLII